MAVARGQLCQRSEVIVPFWPDTFASPISRDTKIMLASRISRFSIVLLLAGLLPAQSQAPQSKDPLGRDTPQGAVFNFLEACHARDYAKAVLYLNLRNMTAADRTKDGSDLARQLEDLLDDTPF